MVKGVVNNWDHMEMVWQNVLTEDYFCAGDLQQYAFVLTDLTFSPKSQREKMTQIMFESFDAPVLRIIDHAVATLGSLQDRTGLVVDMGYDSIRVVPVHNGHALAQHGIELDYGGAMLTEYMLMISSAESRQTAELIKEKLCYVALDYEQELLKAKNEPHLVQKTCDLPNYDVFTLGKYNRSDPRNFKKYLNFFTAITNNVSLLGIERFQCPEVMFSPSMISSPDPSLQQAIYDVLMKVSPDIRSELANRVVVGGMPSLMLGLCERLTAEFAKLWPKQEKFRIISPPGCFIAPLLGACYVHPEWERATFMTKQQYDENGVSLVHSLFY